MNREIKELALTTTSKYIFNQHIDQLPRKMEWLYDEITVTGDRIGENGKEMTETLDLWRRDPVECIRELIGNPAFREVMAYAPERVFTSQDMLNRVFDEMCTADWWWDVQVNCQLC